MFPNSLAATGALLRLKGPARDWKEMLTNSENLTTKSIGSSAWLGITLSSVRPLVPEPEIRSEYNYHYVLRLSAAPGRFLLASTDMKLVDILLDRLEVKRWVAKPSVRIHELVVSLCQKPGAYTLAAVHTRIEGFGQALRNSAFYGNDVGEAILFRELLTRLQAHRVTLRDVTKRTDVLGIGQKGDLSFSYNGVPSLRDVDTALRFISTRGFLDWTSEPEPEGHDGLE